LIGCNTESRYDTGIARNWSAHGVYVEALLVNDEPANQACLWLKSTLPNWGPRCQQANIACGKQAMTWLEKRLKNKRGMPALHLGVIARVPAFRQVESGPKPSHAKNIPLVLSKIQAHVGRFNFGVPVMLNPLHLCI
jgi:hypothetical protein